MPFSQSFSSESRYAFSATLGEGVGLVCVLFLVCFFSCLCLGRFNIGISQEAKEVRTSHDTLADVLEQVEGFFRRLEIYTDVTNSGNDAHNHSDNGGGGSVGCSVN